MFNVQGRVGRYELVRLLAMSHGTSGMVCLAIDTHTRQHVVVKLISRRSTEDVEPLIAAERQGAMMQERLSRRSDAVPRVYDCGDHDGVFYVAMEYVEGDDLDKQIGNGLKLPTKSAVGIVRDVCACLAVAHAPQHLVDGRHRSIVHGDVKPANIRVTPSGRAKLIDFGTAAAVCPKQRCAFSSYLTVEYAPPERIETGVIDAQSDLWGAAVVLYEALFGWRPSESCSGDAECSTMGQRSHSSAALVSAGRNGALAEICARSLAPKRRERYPNAEAFRLALDGI